MSFTVPPMPQDPKELDRYMARIPEFGRRLFHDRWFPDRESQAAWEADTRREAFRRRIGTLTGNRAL